MRMFAYICNSTKMSDQAGNRYVGLNMIGEEESPLTLKKKEDI